MKNNIIVIDSHSHFGNDYFHGNTDLNEYIKMMEKTGVDYGLIMPTPSPIKLEDGLKLRYLGWYLNFNEINYFSDINPEGITNPYKIVNYEYYNAVVESGKKNLFFVPIVHPILDSKEYLEQLISDLDPVAFKIHGVGSGIDPTKISNDFYDVLIKNDIPLIVHTDFDNGVNILRYDTYLLRNLNSPKKWFDCLNKFGVKAVLNHGCALDKYVLNKINNNKLIKVGLGPDLIINYDTDRLMIDSYKYKQLNCLKILREYLNSSKIVFDVDYNWNVDPINGLIDENYLDRVLETWPEIIYQQKILSENIIEHFPKLKLKL